MLMFSLTSELTGFYGAQRSKNPVQRFVIHLFYLSSQRWQYSMKRIVGDFVSNRDLIETG